MPNLSVAGSDPSELRLDHRVSVNPLTGSATIVVPIELTPGRGGFGPVLSLEYDSSGHNSPFGVGWSLNGLLTIARNTRKRLPRYDSHDEFVFSATGELVPALTSQGDTWQPRVDDRGAHWVRLYRSRFES